MQIACYVAAAVFGLFTYLQFNDLEQYGTQYWIAWVLAYGGTAAIALISATRALPRPVYISSALLAIVAAAIRVSSIDWNADIFNNESNPAGNEAGGLLIVGLWFAFLALRRRAADPPAVE